MQIKNDGRLSCLWVNQVVDTTCHIDSIMHDAFHNNFFLLVPAVYCMDLLSLRLTVCQERFIKEKSNHFMVIGLNFNGAKKMKVMVTD